MPVYTVPFDYERECEIVAEMAEADTSVPTTALTGVVRSDGSGWALWTSDENKYIKRGHGYITLGNAISVEEAALDALPNGWHKITQIRNNGMQYSTAFVRKF